MVNAILYQARTGCQWRYLPGHFGPWGAIRPQFRRWRAKGVWEKGPDPAPQGGPDQGRPGPRTVDGHARLSDRQGRTRPARFHEAGGKYGGTFGAKRTVLIDYLSLPVAARVDSARPHDSKTGRMLLDHSLPGLPRVGEVLADLGFEPLVKGIQRRHKVTVTTKGWRKPNKPKGFKLIRPLWKLEDCFAQLGRWRRLSRSYEATTESATTWLHVACVGYLLTKL